MGSDRRRHSSVRSPHRLCFETPGKAILFYVSMYRFLSGVQKFLFCGRRGAKKEFLHSGKLLWMPDITAAQIRSAKIPFLHPAARKKGIFALRKVITEYLLSLIHLPNIAIAQIRSAKIPFLHPATRKKGIFALRKVIIEYLLSLIHLPDITIAQNSRSFLIVCSVIRKIRAYLDIRHRDMKKIHI